MYGELLEVVKNKDGVRISYPKSYAAIKNEASLIYPRMPRLEQRVFIQEVYTRRLFYRNSLLSFLCLGGLRYLYRQNAIDK